jgi:hypothetical protein
MSGGARMLACRKASVFTTENSTSSAAACTAGAFIAGATAKHALKHLPRSTPSPQQSSAGADMLMLSHGVSADCAKTLAAGPKASQKARSVTTRERAFTPAQVISRLYGGQTDASYFASIFVTTKPPPTFSASNRSLSPAFT